ncbi:MAG: hypothetical protein IJ538_01485 [Clostridia bacterium]|nr:hypothetical protein [Clostridia bacterium]
MDNLLPEWLYQEIRNRFLIEFIYEIRIRVNKPIMVNYKGRYLEVSENENRGKFLGTKELINYIIKIATKQSLYSYNDQIKNCYISAEDGIRIGICGDVVSNDNKIITIKNITSLNIRIAHQVFNVSNQIINFVYCQGTVKNTLILSPPGAGKTTMVRDLTLKLSNEKKIQNILVIDERFELAGDGEKKLEIGDLVDVLSGTTKAYAFSTALKTMNPSVIVTDEISTREDIEAAKISARSGVKVIATAHAESLLDIKSNKFLKETIAEKIFERIIIMSKRNGVGTIEGIFDQELRCIYVPYLV